MIVLTKLDGSCIAVNIDAIKYVEAVPDTVVLFLNGESVLVQESVDAILVAIVAFKAAVVRASSVALNDSPPSLARRGDGVLLSPEGPGS